MNTNLSIRAALAVRRHNEVPIRSFRFLLFKQLRLLIINELQQFQSALPGSQPHRSPFAPILSYFELLCVIMRYFELI